MRPARKLDCTEHYDYFLLYVDCYLAISKHPKGAILQIDIFKIQDKSVGPLDIYLSGEVSSVPSKYGGDIGI